VFTIVRITSQSKCRNHSVASSGEHVALLFGKLYIINGRVDKTDKVQAPDNPLHNGFINKMMASPVNRAYWSIITNASIKTRDIRS
jgi:hypothetical protein